MKIDIVYEDKNVIVVNKPAGLLVHSTTPERSEIEKTLAGWILSRFPEVVNVGDSENRPGIVHRLDKDTSGIMVIAKNQKVFEHLKNQFQNRDVKKTYKAIIFGTPEEAEGIIDKQIGLKAGTTKRTVFGGKMVKEALTKYKILESFKDASYLEISPKTGRTHQIRVHLASIGHPILGDKLYSSKTSKKIDIPGINRQMLHAYSLEIESIEGGKMFFIADIPEDFKKVLQYLGDTVHSKSND